MAPSASEPTAQQPRRQSCDGCYSKKLRCTRPGNTGTGPCDRCLRNGTQCRYSPCLPKGRPSLYRTTEVHGSGSDAPKSAGASAAGGRVGRGSGTDGGDGSDSGADQSAPNSGSSAPAPASANMTTSLIDPDVQLHHDTLNGAFLDFSDTFWHGEGVGDCMLGVLPSSGLTLDIAAAADSPLGGMELSALPTGNSTATMDCFGSEGDFDSLLAGSNRSDRRVSDLDRGDSEASVAQLSRLSTRLSQLLGSSRRFLADSLDPVHPQLGGDEPTMQVQLGVEAVFKSMNAWLVHGSANADRASGLNSNQTNTFDLLYQVFSASNHLLEILNQVRTSALPGSVASSSSGYSTPGLSSSSVAESSSSRSSMDAGHHSYSVVNHLILVCVTLLLNMYATILIALQRGVDTLDSSLHFRARSQSKPGDPMDTRVRTHLQLVSVVQMCGYFIKRQNQSLDMITLNHQASMQPPSREFDTLHSVSPGSIGDMKIEVEQRLRRLQGSLCIIA